jgi:hypothetical protein
MDLMETGLDWIHLSQDRDWWQAFVNMVMTVGFHKGRKFLDKLSVLIAPQE